MQPKSTPMPAMLWLAAIEDPKVREKAMKACEEQGEPADEVHGISSAILNGFPWITAKEGHVFWRKEYDRARYSELAESLGL